MFASIMLLKFDSPHWLFCLMLIDAKARADAINPEKSYIVQAPAGSGKTELLTQRFLALLATVDSPEQIIAITFTKKAAAEMRERVMAAIKKGLVATAPTETHLVVSYRLAKKVLKQDANKQWQLLQQPQRLRIQTIDSLCSYLCSQMPLLSQLLPYASIKPDCFDDYMLTVKQALDFCLSNDKTSLASETLLLHVGNHHERLVSLFAKLLANRNQWLNHLLEARGQARAYFEATLKELHRDAAKNAYQALPDVEHDALLASIHYAGNCLASDNPLAILANIDSFADLQTEEAIDCWQALARMLLDTNYRYRKTLTKNQGFFAANHFSNKTDRLRAKNEKASMSSLLKRLSDNEAFRQALELCLRLPTPTYSKQQWETVQALFTLLPVLAAMLRLHFSEQGYVDFNEVAQTAIEALTQNEQVTELGLYLDYRIQHLLIDEFQDTSHQQFRLLEQLTMGWEPDDGRSLFIVGDPMQSIYRFREAEVSLFIRAKRHGINNIPLHFLQLQANFRSAPAIVDYINQKFSQIFPKQDNVELSAVSYSAAFAMQPANAAAGVQAFRCTDRQHEAVAIVDTIKQRQDQSVAILVRSRGQLTEILRALRNANIQSHSIDLDSLESRPIIQDLLSLIKVLLNPYDNIALLSLLRTPWIGLSLASLEALVQQSKTTHFFTTLCQLAKSPLTNNDCNQRALKLAALINHALNQRHRQSFCLTAFYCFKALQGSIIMAQADQDDSEQFWQLLDEATLHAGNIQTFEASLYKLYAKPSEHSNIQLMTIHKSKGLEFDCVILPGIEKSRAPVDSPLLLWTELNHDTANSQLLLAPMKSIYQDKDAIYQFVSYLEKQKERYEMDRVLYVALTRAKQSIVLFTTHEDEKLPTNSSYLAQLKPTLEDYPTVLPVASDKSSGGIQRFPAVHFTKPLDWPCISSSYVGEEKTLRFDIMRLIGIFIHEKIQHFCEAKASAAPPLSDKNWVAQLQFAGIDADGDITRAIELTHRAIRAFEECTHGQWIANTHQEASNELAVNSAEGQAVIDRTFIDNGKRWIIDYKLGETTAETYYPQLQRYAKLFAEMDNRPIQCALYYPLQRQFILVPSL